MMTRFFSVMISFLIYFLPQLRGQSKKQQNSTVELIIVNLLVFLGVLIGGWDIYYIMVLYWFETLIIGAITFFKLAFGALNSPKVSSGKRVGFFLFHCIFFIIHFGAFMGAHIGMTIVFLWINLRGQNVCRDFEPCMAQYFKFDGLNNLTQLPFTLFSNYILEILVLSLLLMRGLHAFYVFDWKEKRYLNYDPSSTVDVQNVMMAPYGRVIHMHLALIVGGFLAMAKFSGVYMALIWVVVKTYLDLKGDKDLIGIS